MSNGLLRENIECAHSMFFFAVGMFCHLTTFEKVVKWLYHAVTAVLRRILGMKVTKNLTEGNVYRNLLLYTIPLILSSLLSLTYTTIDGMIAGKCIGAFAMGAISATSSFHVLINALFIGISEGFTIYASHLFGQGNFSAIKRSIASMTWFVGMISLCVSLLVILFRDTILDYLNVDPLLRADAERYFIIYTMGYVVFFINMFWVRALYALGITSFSLYISAMSAVLNIGGNLLTVLVFDMGVAGLAVSTLVSSLAASVFYIIMLRKAFREMSSESVTLRFSPAAVRSSMRYTIPVAVQKMAFLGIALVIAPAINALGAAATTGYGIANQLYNIGTMTIWAATSAFGCYTGQCVGEGNTKKIRRGVRIGFEINSVLLLPIVLGIALLARPVVSIFFPEGYDGEAYTYAVRYARIYVPLIYVQLVDHILHAYMRALGRVGMVLGATLVGGATRIAATFALIPLLGLEGAFLAEVISWGMDAVICLVICILRYRTDEHLTQELALKNT